METIQLQQARKAKFDPKYGNGDGFLIEAEVGERFWSKVSDADSQVTFDKFVVGVATQQHLTSRRW